MAGYGMLGTLESIFVYPVKSCAGLSLQQAVLTPFGLKGDRQFMIVNEEGTMLTQRANAALSLIQPSVNATDLSLSFPQQGTVAVKLSDGRKKTVKIWKDTVDASLAENEVNEWLTYVLKSDVPLYLVRFDPNTIRLPGSVDRFGKTGRHFADAAPILVANNASLLQLNRVLKAQNKPEVAISSFRPNLVINGLKAFDEHKLRSISVPNGKHIMCVDHCERCLVISIDQSTGKKRGNMVPFHELASINSMPNKKKPAFGVNSVLHRKDASTPLSVSEPLNFHF
jgi:uncharacterized protein YcbX